MRKSCKRKVIPRSVPMLINRGLKESDIEIRERMLVQAFALGFATTAHFDDIADMRNVLTLAAAYKSDESTLAMCHGMRECMSGIRERHSATGRIGASGDELRMLQAFCGVYRDFWMRQPVMLYEQACEELLKVQATGAMGICCEVAA